MPVNSTWGLENRTVAIRVKGLAGAGLHLKNRAADWTDRVDDFEVRELFEFL